MPDGSSPPPARKRHSRYDLARAQIIGQRFGTLTAVMPLQPNSNGNLNWLFRCDQGHETRRLLGNVRTQLVRGDVVRCQICTGGLRLCSFCRRAGHGSNACPDREELAAVGPKVCTVCYGLAHRRPKRGRCPKCRGRFAEEAVVTASKRVMTGGRHG